MERSSHRDAPYTTGRMIELDGRTLDLAALAAIVHERQPVRLAEAARREMERSRSVVERALAEGRAIYGVTTGFGDLADVAIAADQRRELQVRLLASHAAGVGVPLPAAAVRAMLVLRANALARGYSGVRPLIVDRLLEHLNRDLLPVVPSRGSVGASGDLAPLAHLALPLVGKGQLVLADRAAPAAEALAEAGFEPLVLEAKEGLALINGTQAMTALTALACLEGRRLVRAADLIGALSAEALRGTDTAFDPRLHAARPHPGQQASAGNLWRLMRGSAIRESHRLNDPRLQDPYSLRCMPQVHGAVRDALADVERRLAIEINSATDNPLVFADSEEILSGGNFHGEPVAIAADLAAIALAELAAISERRIEKLTNAQFSGLPPFLVRDAGLNSGFMMAQVTAAALVAENRVLAHPASVDSIPTSADKEDHVSMGMGSALKLQEVVANARRVLAIELLAAAQGIDLLRPLTSTAPLEALHGAVRQRVPAWEHDREMSPDLARAEEFLIAAVDPHLRELA